MTGDSRHELLAPLQKSNPGNSEPPPKILVTGGAGFIGANVVRELLDHGWQVTVLDNFSAGRREYLKGLPITFIEGDILDSDLANRAVRGHDGIVHLAAQTGVPGSLADPRRDCEVNVIGTLNLLEALRTEVERRKLTKGRSGTGEEGDRKETASQRRTASAQMRFVFASSNAPLGRQPPPATEDKAPLPISPYGASKLSGEAYSLGYHGSWGLGTVALRFGNAYGPFSTHKHSVVAKFFKDILTKGEVTIDGDGKQTRDFIYVGDLCRAILLALESDVGGEVFQIATGVETSILDLSAMTQEVAERKTGVHHVLPRQGDIRKNYSSIAKVQDILGWKPSVELIEGLRKTWEWFVHTMVQDTSR